MSILKYLTKIEHMDSLIARKATGSSVCFAKKVDGHQFTASKEAHYSHLKIKK